MKLTGAQIEPGIRVQITGGDRKEWIGLRGTLTGNRGCLGGSGKFGIHVLTDDGFYIYPLMIDLELLDDVYR